jgi:hypothetical protein
MDTLAGPEQHVWVLLDMFERLAEIPQAVRRPHDIGMQDQRHDAG